MGKAHEVPRSVSVRAASRCLERLLLDLTGPITPAGRSGEEYLLVVTDEFSVCAEAVPLKHKSSAPAAIVDLVAVFENQLQPLRVTRTHSDPGREFDNSVLDAWAARKGITQRVSPAYTPKSNVRSERQNLAIKELTIVLMNDMHIPADLWPDLVRYGSCYLLNRRPRQVSGRFQIPYEVLTGHSAQYQHLRSIGSPCEVLLKNKEPRPKFSSRTVPGILLGYASDDRNSTCVYRVYVPSVGQVQNSVDVHILEPSRRVLPQESTPPDGEVTTHPGDELARRTPAPRWSPSPGEAPLVRPLASPGVSSGGTGGCSASGARLQMCLMLTFLRLRV
jgi:transposase InsO family protein